MVFSSVVFLLCFLPVFLLAYQFIDKRFKNILILTASLIFYAWGAPSFFFILLASTILDFYIVKALNETPDRRKKRFWLTLSVTMNLGLLIYFKYSNFFIENMNAAFSRVGLEPVFWTNVVLPIGISFYTFQTLTYSFDVYRNVHKPLAKLSDYLLYIMSFPQMIAGPIVRFNEIADQIVEREEIVDDKLQGFFRFAIGLAKKVLIANVLGEQADIIMNQNPETLGTMTAWIGIIAYSFQIYFDFAGYSDMAIGLGQMIGFRFPENFDNPYTSRSISEFWRRWHITLGRFMKYYLYIPLGGNRAGKYRVFFNLWIVFLLSGLWHGASWNFVIWGAYHGLFLILDRLFLLRMLKTFGKIPSVLFTFLIVVVGWVFFRIESLAGAWAYLRAMFSYRGGTSIIEFVGAFEFILVLAIVFSFITLFSFGKKLEYVVYYLRDPGKKWYLSMFVLSLLLFILSLSSITTADFNPFIYFRF